MIRYIVRTTSGVRIETGDRGVIDALSVCNRIKSLTVAAIPDLDAARVVLEALVREMKVLCR